MVNRMIWNQTAYFGAGAVGVIPEELARRDPGHDRHGTVAEHG